MKKYSPIIALCLTMIVFAIVNNRSFFFTNSILWAFAWAFCFKAAISKEIESQKYIILLAPRLCILLFLPSFSDDFYRFFWDAQVSSLGINVYQYKPIDLIDKGFSLQFYDQLNSKNYYSVYPPLVQYLFNFCFWAGQKSLWGFVITFKLFLIVVDLLNLKVIALLSKNKKLSYSPVILYALCPFLILEFNMNLHLEIIAVCFLLYSVWLLKNILSTAVFFSLSILVKLNPLILLPYLLTQFEKKKALLLLILSTIIIVLSLSITSISAFPLNVLESLNLYFQAFEFNASIFYFVNYITSKINGYDSVQIIGPVLSYISTITILIVSYLLAKKKVEMLFSIQILFAIYLLFSPIVHPWYVSIILILSIINGKFFGFIWAILVFLSYYSYKFDTVSESNVLLLFQYSIVIYSLINAIKILPKYNTSKID